MARLDASLARHIDEILPELTVRLELEDQVRQMTDSRAYRAVAEIVDAEAHQVAASMATTRPLEHAEYTMRHGRIGGLRAFQSAAETFLARTVEEREEQESQHEAGGESPAER